MPPLPIQKSPAGRGFGPSGEAASDRRIIQVPDVFADPSLEDWQEVASELGFKALVAPE